MLIYALIYIPLVVAWLVYFRFSRRRDQRNLARIEATVSSGLTEPFSLHPFIDPSKCLGSGACVLACPEGDVLGMIGGKSKLINPTHCIGHGACRSACPMRRSRSSSERRSGESTFRMSARRSRRTCPASSSPASWAGWG